MSRPIRIAILANGKQAKSEMRSVAKETSTLGKIGKRAGSVLKKGLLAGAAGAAALAGTAIFKGFGRLKALDEAKSKLTGLGHDAKSVTRIMDSATKAVTGTAFGLDEAATASAGAVAAGVKPGKDLERTLTLVGDAATIAGTDMGRMGSIFNKVAASNRVTMGVVNQMQTAGIPVLTKLADHFGVTAAEAGKMVSAGKVGFEDFQTVMEKTLGGAAQESGNTFAGAMANAQAALGRLGAKLLDGTFQQMPKLFQRFGKSMDRLGPFAEKAGKVIGSRLSGAVEKVTGLAGKMFSPKTLKSQSDRIDVLRKTGERLWAGTKKLATGTRDLLREFKPAIIKTFNTVLDGTMKVVDGAGKVFDKTSGLVGGTGTALSKIPDPVKEIAVQAGIAALVMPRLTSASQAMGRQLDLAQTSVRVLALEMRDGTARSKMLQTGLARVGAAARGAAGIAGMVALSQGAQTANQDLKTLANVGGGALMGFSVAGPIGAAIGGIGGLLVSTLSGGADRAKGSLSDLKFEADDLKGSLDGLTGATTEATRAMVLQELQTSGVLKQTRDLGLADRQVVNSIMGQGKARENLVGIMGEEKAALEAKKAALDEEIASLEKARRDYGIGGVTHTETEEALKSAHATRDKTEARLADVAALEKEVTAVDKARKEKEADIRATREFTGAIKNLPKKARFELRSQGITNSRKDLADFAARHKLTPKQLNFLFRAIGEPDAKRKMESVRKKAEELGKVKPDMKGVKAGVDRGFAAAEGAATKGGKKVSDKLQNSTAKAKPKMEGFKLGVSSGASQAAGLAMSGGLTVGSNLGSGAAFGIAGAVGRVQAAARAMVRATIASANAEARIKSPSRKMMEHGRFLAEGAAAGIKRNVRKPVAAMRSMVQAVIAAATGRTGDGIVARITDSARRSVEAQNQRELKSFRQQQNRAKKRFYANNKSDKARRKFDRQQEKALKRRERLVERNGKRALKAARPQIRALAQNARAQQRINDRLTEARSKVQELTAAREAHRDAIKQSYVELANLTNLDEGHLNNPQALLEQLRAQEKVGERFYAAIKALQAQGLNDTSLQQLLDRGPEAGLAAAEALVSGGAGMVDEVNQIVGRMADQGDLLGKTMAGKFHDAGIEAAKGLVKGLESQQAQLEKVAKRLGKQISKAIRKQLGIKSPSRVLADDARDAARGLIVGLGSSERDVHRAGVSVAEALRSGVTTQRRLTARLDPRDAWATANQAPTDARSITVRLTAEQVSSLQRGREIQMDLDAYQRAGGRRRA